MGVRTISCLVSALLLSGCIASSNITSMRADGPHHVPRNLLVVPLGGLPSMLPTDFANITSQAFAKCSIHAVVGGLHLSTGDPVEERIREVRPDSVLVITQMPGETIDGGTYRLQLQEMPGRKDVWVADLYSSTGLHRISDFVKSMINKMVEDGMLPPPCKIA